MTAAKALPVDVAALRQRVAAVKSRVGQVRTWEDATHVIPTIRDLQGDPDLGVEERERLDTACAYLERVASFRVSVKTGCYFAGTALAGVVAALEGEAS